jgi:SAM-dependent methyltransferase
MEDGRVPLPSESLDAVLFVDVLEHVPDPAGLLDEAARVLQPGGRLIAIVPVEGERLSFYELFRAVLGRDTYEVTKEHVQSFTHASLTDLFERRFRLEHRRYAYHFLGQLMDAGFFAAARLERLRRFWWNENAYYNAPSESQPAPLAVRALNKLLQAGNALAWAESVRLAQSRTGACAVLVDAARKDHA